MSQSTKGKIDMTVDKLAEIIRKVDGNHKLGAGALAEAIMSELDKEITSSKQPTEQQPDVTQLVEALEGIMRVEARDRVMPVGAEWDAARAALAAYRKKRGGGE